MARTIEEKVSDWLRVYEAVRVEITPAPMRTILAEMKEVENAAQLQSYVKLAGDVLANDRQAAIVAAMLLSGTTRRRDFDDALLETVGGTD